MGIFKTKIFRWVLFCGIAVFAVAGGYGGSIIAGAYYEWNERKPQMMEKFDRLYQRIVVRKEKYLRFDRDMNVEKIQPTEILDGKNRVIGRFLPAGAIVVPWNEVPAALPQIIIAMEDRNFYRHRGVDVFGILRAALLNLSRFKLVAGGSTITQQLAKVLFTRRQKTLRRKAFEAFAAMDIERRYKKQHILQMYINLVYLGHGCYGIGSAAQVYFNKKVIRLRFEETALIVSLLTAPNTFSPINNLALSQKKVDVVLAVMVEQGIISEDMARRGRDRLWGQFEEKIVYNMANWAMDVNEAPYFNEYVRKTLIRYLTEDNIRGGGLKIYTTLDINKQKAAGRVLQEGLKKENLAFAKKAGVQEKVKYPIEGAVVTVNIKTGGIEAMVGGSMFRLANQMNRVVQARRQVGSVFKPFVYALAFDKGVLAPDGMIEDKLRSYTVYRNTWRPRNYDNKYLGEITVSEAIVKSRNTCAALAAHRLGAEALADFLNRFFDSKKRFNPFLSNALGTMEMTPLEVAALYLYMARQGRFKKPYSIARVTGPGGNVILSYPEVGTIDNTAELDKEKLISAQSLAHAALILRGVMAKGGTAYEAAKAARLTEHLSVKTGTTGDYNDAWLAGFDTTMVTVVYLGRDRRIGRGNVGLSGGSSAAPIWMNYMKAAMRWNWRLTSEGNLK